MPDQFSGGNTHSLSSKPQKRQRDKPEAPALSDISARDKPWDKHRTYAAHVEDLYRGTEFDGYSKRIHFCSDLLQFRLTPSDAGNGVMRPKLEDARFCRLRHCPVCQWRRSLRWKARAHKILPRMIEKYPKHRWLFLTLTLKNVPIDTLRETLTHMNKSFRRMADYKRFPAVGWLRSTEVTYGRDGNAHPHFHCLLLVQPSFFAGRNYVKQEDWVSMWRRALQVDYDPILDVRAIKQGSKPMELIPEVLKYCVKESDLVRNKEWFLELTRQMHGMKLVATGGLLKQSLKELEDEPVDFIGNDDADCDSESDDFLKIYFGWKRAERRYRLVQDQ